MQGKNKAKCIILPNAKWKIVWDFFIVFLLLLVSIIVPFRLAFSPTDGFDWVVTYSAIDSFFFIDMILTFFTAVVDHKSQNIYTSKAVIAKQYLQFWFWIDLVSILPLDLLNMSGMSANALIRFTKIGKLYKLIRLSRLAKLFKLLKG